MNAASFRANTVDYPLILVAAFLLIFGLVMLGSASANLGSEKFGDNYYFLKHQLLYGLAPGVLGFFLASRIYYGRLQKAAIPLLAAAILMLLLVFSSLGLKAGGADRWLDLGLFSFQPAEILKFAVIVYLAAWLSGSDERNKSVVKGFLPFAALMSGLGFILLKQSSTSTFAIILAVSSIIYFASGARFSYLLATAVLGLCAILTISFFTPYRWSRIMSYLQPETNLETSGYHINQALIAIGSGGAFGVGLGESTTKIRYLPEPIGDSVFAVIAEELGFAGVILTIMGFAFVSTRMLVLAKNSGYKFGQLLLVGFGSLIGIQTFINIGAISGLIPLTGMPLPFVSYGGTALAVFLTMTGVAANISKYSR